MHIEEEAFLSTGTWRGLFVDRSEQVFKIFFRLFPRLLPRLLQCGVGLKQHMLTGSGGSHVGVRINEIACPINHHDMLFELEIVLLNCAA